MIFFIPGGAGSPKMFSAVFAAFLKAIKVEVKFLEYPDYIYKEYQISISSYLEYFKEQIRQSSISGQPNYIIGFSLGGYFALRLTEDKSLAIAKTILLSPFLAYEGNIFKVMFYRQRSMLLTKPQVPELKANYLLNIKEFVFYFRNILLQTVNVIMKIKPDIYDQIEPKSLVVIRGSRDRTIANEKKYLKTGYREHILTGDHDLLTGNLTEVVKLVAQELEIFAQRKVR
jgi:pimeloyl-ACP methyl ester carboxylesterase